MNQPIAIAALLGLTLGSALGRTEPVDPTLPTRIVVGAPRGPAPMARLDAQRTGRSATPLPSRPKLLFSARAPAGVDFAVAVDELGAIIAASSAGALVQVDGNGRMEWLRRTGSPPTVGPVLLSNGRRAVVTLSGELLAFDRRGRTVLRRMLPIADARAVAPPLPLDDGGLGLGIGDTLVRLERDGELIGQARVDGIVKSIAARGSELLAITERGSVFSWQAPRPPVRLGSFGGRIDESAALSGPDRLLAVVEHRRLSELRLTGGVRVTRVADPVLTLLGPPVLAADGGARVLTMDGLLLYTDARGKETLRVPLDPRAGTGDSAGFAPPVVIDDAGRIAFTRPSREAGIILPSGEIVAASGASCPDPVALAPAGRERFVVGCRSGLLLMIGQ